MTDPYFGREQTKVKHFILKRYLQALAFKILGIFDVCYVDGFSGPWETQTEDFSGISSFMIAIDVLKDAQHQILVQTGRRPTIRCFFRENNGEAFTRLETAIAPFNRPSEGFEIKPHFGDFEDAVSEIQRFIGHSFPLIFIDPKGSTGYSFDKIRPLFARPKCEVLINFMYDFVNRAASMRDKKTIASLAPILGGPNWEERLDTKLPRGRAVEQLFRDTLKAAGDFDFVVSTKIDRSTMDRPHFFIVYGTKSPDGLKAFREIEYGALRAQARQRADAKERQREVRSGTPDLFSGLDAVVQESAINDIVDDHKQWALEELLSTLQVSGPMRFSEVWAMLLQAHPLRVTNIKNICVELARAEKIENTWGRGNRKPQDRDVIRLK